MHARSRSASLLVSSWLAVGCVGGTSATGTTDSSSGAGGSGPAGCIKVDCSVPANESTPECDFSAEPGSIGEGPPFLGDSPNMRRGFVEGSTIYLPFHDGSSGAVFAVDVESGARTFLSGVLEDPQTGPQPRGSGPSLGTPWDVARAPDGKLYVLVDNEMGRQILLVDEGTGDRSPAADLAMFPCSVGEETVQLDPQLEPLPNGNVLLIGDANGGSGLFEIDVASDACTTISFASDDANQLGTGPRFFDFQSLTLGEGRAFVSDANSSSLVEIDLSNGNRLRVSSSDSATPVGEGPLSGTESILALGDSVFAARDAGGSAILVETDLSSGNRTEYFSTDGPVSNPSEPMLYGELDGCFYLGSRDTLYVFDPASGRSNRISR
jgi:hypothetical protein